MTIYVRGINKTAYESKVDEIIEKWLIGDDEMPEMDFSELTQLFIDCFKETEEGLTTEVWELVCEVNNCTIWDKNDIELIAWGLF